MIIDSKQYAGRCACGKTHTLQTAYTVVERGCMKKLNALMAQNGVGGFTVAVYDANTYAATADRHPQADAEIVLQPGETDAAKWVTFPQVHEMIERKQICKVIANQFILQEPKLLQLQSK